MNKALSGAQEAVRRQLTAVRRKAGEQSILAFARAYLPVHFKLAPSSMHTELFSELQNATVQRGARLAIAAPRGHAKSTIVSLTYVLWSICYHKESFILLISNTFELSSDFLSQIKQELQCNVRLLEDFPEVCEPLGAVPGAGMRAPRWRRDEIITRNGVKVTALSAEKQIRGRRHRENRPTLIVMDDIENEAEVRSDDQRRNREEWFAKAVLKAGTRQSNVIVVGTVLHYDALLAKLIDSRKSPDWTGRKYQAVCECLRESEYPPRARDDGRENPDVQTHRSTDNRCRRGRRQAPRAAGLPQRSRPRSRTESRVVPTTPHWRF